MFSGRRERKDIHSWARDLLQSLQGLRQACHHLQSEATAHLHHARRITRDKNVAIRLAGLSVEHMDYDGPKVPATKLHAAGLHTAADVHRQRRRLDRVPGIGSVSVAKLRQGLEHASQVRAADLRPALDERTWRADEVDLVAALHTLDAAKAFSQAPEWQVLEPVMHDLRRMVDITRFGSWVLSGADAKRRVRVEHQALRERAHAPFIGAALNGLLRRREHVEDLAQNPLSARDLGTHWTRVNATLMALLEQVTLQEGEPVEQEVILSGAGRPLLPADLAQEIASLHLERSLLRKELRLYQEVGAAFALVVGRAILGDEMGLGKSVQALAAIAHVIVRERQHHHLVICPASVVDTWLQEIAETLHDVPAFTYRGKDADVDRRRWAASRGIMVVSYEMTRSLVNHPLPHLGFAIVDEAHLVKNPSSRRSQTTAELVTPAKRCLLMGGTPMENNAEEFLHLIELVDPDKGRALRGLFNRAERAYREPDRFRHAIADIYLRRNKHEVIRELPPLTWRDERILLNSAQQRTYEQTILTRPLITARRLLTTIGGTDGGKMQRLRDIAEECRANGQKLLVFSFFLDALDMAGTVLNGDVAHIRGGMSAAEKTRNTEGFENAHGFSALLIQIIAGGHGLNLHSASVVVVIEPQYKPTTEWQAIGRAHRIGQTRPVTVYRLIAHDTVETRLIERTGFKAEIFNRLARPSDLAEDIEARISDRLDNPDDLLDEERQRIRDRPPPD